VNASQRPESLPSRRRIHRLSVTLLGCVVAAATLTACGGTVPTTAPVLSETSPLLSHSYSVESNELVEVSHFADGSVKYTPTGWIVAAPLTATATAGSSGH
jgi:hypothetical protein